jgi:hypothetical protein
MASSARVTAAQGQAEACAHTRDRLPCLRRSAGSGGGCSPPLAGSALVGSCGRESHMMVGQYRAVPWALADILRVIYFLVAELGLGYPPRRAGTGSLLPNRVVRCHVLFKVGCARQFEA